MISFFFFFLRLLGQSLFPGQQRSGSLSALSDDNVGRATDGVSGSAPPRGLYPFMVDCLSCAVRKGVPPVGPPHGFTSFFRRLRCEFSVFLGSSCRLLSKRSFFLVFVMSLRRIFRGLGFRFFPFPCSCSLIFRTSTRFGRERPRPLPRTFDCRVNHFTWACSASFACLAFPFSLHSSFLVFNVPDSPVHAVLTPPSFCGKRSVLTPFFFPLSRNPGTKNTFRGRKGSLVYGESFPPCVSTSFPPFVSSTKLTAPTSFPRGSPFPFAMEVN